MIFELIDSYKTINSGCKLYIHDYPPPATIENFSNIVSNLDGSIDPEEDWSSHVWVENPIFQGHETRINIEDPWLWNFIEQNHAKNSFISYNMKMYPNKTISFDDKVELVYFDYLLRLNRCIYTNAKRIYSHPYIIVTGLTFSSRRKKARTFGHRTGDDSIIDHFSDALGLDGSDFADDQIVITDIDVNDIYGAQVDMDAIYDIRFHPLARLIMYSFTKEAFLKFKLSHPGIFG